MLTRRTPLARKSLKTRRLPAVRCKTRGCKRPPRYAGFCASHAQREADRLFSLFVRARDGRCMAGGGHSPRLQCAHIISRRYHATRWDPENAVALCQGHHVYFTHRPLEWQNWVGFDRYDAIRRRALWSEVPDLAEVIEWLRGKVAA